MKPKQIIFLFLFLLMVNPHAYVQSQPARFIQLKPRGTELVEQKREEATEFIITSTYKYHSQSSQKQIVKFYRYMFSQEGFKESRGHKPRRGSKKLVFVFTKKDKIVILNFLPHPERDKTTYYLGVTQVNIPKEKK